MSACINNAMLYCVIGLINKWRSDTLYICQSPIPKQVCRQCWGPFHYRFFHRKSDSMETSFRSPFGSKEKGFFFSILLRYDGMWMNDREAKFPLNLKYETKTNLVKGPPVYREFLCPNSLIKSNRTKLRLPISHDDVIKWKHFPRYWPFVWGIHRSPVTSL